MLLGCSVYDLNTPTGTDAGCHDIIMPCAYLRDKSICLCVHLSDAYGINNKHYNQTSRGKAIIQSYSIMLHNVDVRGHYQVE